MVHRTGKGRGNIEIEITLRGFGLFRMTAETKRVRVAKRREAFARQLAENGQFETLRALKQRKLAWSQIEQAHKQERLNDAALLSDLRVQSPLWTAIKRTTFSKKVSTQAWYTDVLEQLRTLGYGDGALVADLSRDDWPELLAGWNVSAARKNGLRRAVSRFLTKYLGKKQHSFRHAVIDPETWPVEKVPKRMRGVSIENFVKLMQKVRATDEICVPAYWTLAASGMRVGELLNDEKIEVDGERHLIYPDGKTGPQEYAVLPALWHYVELAIPCRVARMRKQPKRLQDDARYKKLYRVLHRAGVALGIQVTVHDLRRLYAREGVSRLGETATQTAMGHATPEMTRDYARWDSKHAVAAAVGQALLSGEKSGKLKTRPRTRRSSTIRQREAQSA